MVFSTPIFLFGFLPITLFLYYLSPKALNNIVLLSMSLLFYAWGEVFYVGVMFASILANYIFGRLIDRASSKGARRYLACGIIVNVGLLISFKYANFLVDNINIGLSLLNISTISLNPVHLPIGISFFTFQAISYIVDVYRKEAACQENIIGLALYISLFPQLIAGPIVRFHDVHEQISARTHSMELFAGGTKRFIYGLAKKMLIANPLGQVADNVFSLSGHALTMPLAWIGVLAYTLQIYFDFSGYSDMAIGLGRMFGFRFLENFNYPYIAASVREFWRRWHISLSTWLRDYLYIPMGGSRVRTLRVYTNLVIVFMVTGIWHGASWNFLIWGLFHGFFLAIEHAGFSDILSKIWKPIQHAYLLSVVILGWVFFRADTLTGALAYLHAMVDMQNYQTTHLQFAQVLSHEAVYAFMGGCFFSAPIYVWIKKRLSRTIQIRPVKNGMLIKLSEQVVLWCLMVLSMVKVAASTYNPFIYFRF